VTPEEAAHAFLPAWTGPAALLFWGAWSFVFSVVATRLVAILPLRAFRRLGDAHWTEQARVAHPLRQVLGASLIAPVLMAGFEVGRLAGPFVKAPRIALVLVVMAGSLAGWSLVARRINGALHGELLSWRAWLREAVTGLLLAWPHVLWLALLAPFIPPRMGPAAVAVLAVATLGFGLLYWKSGLAILRLLGWARPASDRLQAVFDRAAESMRIRPVAVWEVPWSVANAFAFPLRRDVAVTDGALRLLDDHDLTTLAHHELAHLEEPPRVRLARSLVWVLFLLMVAAPPVTGSWGWAGLTVLCVVAWGLALALLALSRRQEQAADAAAKAGEGEAGREAACLEKLYRAELIPVVQGSRLVRSHPDLWDRMLAAGVQPSYPRPKPPRFRASLFLALFTIILLWQLLTWTPGLTVLTFLPDQEDRIAFRIGVLGESVEGFWSLSLLRQEQGRFTESADFYRLSFEQGEPYAEGAAALAEKEVFAGRCQKAAEALEMARRLPEPPSGDEPWWTSATRLVGAVCQ
jgi:Zn-dependent protease with chaperone function